MTEHRPLPSRGSLLERAAQVYDFKAELGKRAAAAAETAPPPAPAPVPSGEAPASAPAPHAIRRHDVMGRSGTVDRAELRRAGFVLPDEAAGQIAEEFRIAKRHLLLAASGGGSAAVGDRARLILLASAQPDEGKTFCAVNLALSIAAEKDVQVLLIDGDFSKPEVLSMLGLEGGPGFLDALADPLLDPASCVIRTDIPNLLVMPAGRQSNEATELLASERTRDVLDRLLGANPQRVILFDSAPALATSQASVLALHAGQVLMIVRADQTSEPELKEALQLLSRAPSIQLLLNGVRFAPRGRRFGSYYGQGE